MTEPTPTEFVAAHELSRYPAEKVLALIEAAKDWRFLGPTGGDGFTYREDRDLARAIDALTEGSTDRE